MKQIRNYSLRFTFCVGLLIPACGANDNDNVNLAGTKQNLSQGRGGSENSGLPDATQENQNELGLSEGTSFFISDWYQANADGTPAFYRPKNFDNAMSSYVHIEFNGSGEKCSGIRTYEKNASGSYNIYVMTAAHCLFSVNPLGVRSGQIAQSHSFTMTQYAPEISNNERTDVRIRTDRNIPSKFRERFFRREIKSNFAGLRPQQAGNSDVVRFLIGGPISEESARASAMPLCDPQTGPAVDVLDRAKTNVFSSRFALGWNKNIRGLPARGTYSQSSLIGGVHLLSMHGKHSSSLGNRFPGELGAISERYHGSQSVIDFLTQTQSFSPNGLYAYTSLAGKGVEASDSGAPVLFGYVEQPSVSTFSNLSEAQVKSWKENVGSDLEQFKVTELSCVSGVITREFWLRAVDIVDWVRPNGVMFDTGIRLKNLDVKSISDSNVSVVQVILNTQSWMNR